MYIERELVIGRIIKEFLERREKILERELQVPINHEIQEVPKWELFIKRVVEGEGALVYVTGSSSKLLSKEIATELRGRTITYELFPFNFKELMKINGMHPEKFITTAEESKIKKLVKDYLAFGGFPEVVLKNEKRKILTEYADIMFYRDLVERHKIKNLKVARVFFNLLFNSFAKEISVNKIFNFMKSQGIKTSRNMLYNYLEYNRMRRTRLHAG